MSATLLRRRPAIAATSARPVVASERSKTFTAEQLGLGRLLVNRRRDRRAVAEPIDARRRPVVPSSSNATPPARPPTCGCAACTPLSIDRDPDAAAGPAGERRRATGVDAAVIHARGHGRRRTARRRARANAPPRALELRRRAVLDDPRAVEHDDLVGGAHELEPMRDQDRRPAVHDAAIAVDDLPFGGRIERRAGLVEDQHGRVGEERARQRDPLALAGRQREPAVADDRRRPSGSAATNARGRRPRAPPRSPRRRRPGARSARCRRSIV